MSFPENNTLPDYAVLMRRMWDALHRYAAVYTLHPEARPREALDWLRVWEGRFPADCPCRDEFRAACALVPPPVEVAGMDFFQWTIALHDRINALLRKPLWQERSRKHPLLHGLPLL